MGVKKNNACRPAPHQLKKGTENQGKVPKIRATPPHGGEKHDSASHKLFSCLLSVLKSARIAACESMQRRSPISHLQVTDRIGHYFQQGTSSDLTRTTRIQ